MHKYGDTFQKEFARIFFLGYINVPYKKSLYFQVSKIIWYNESIIISRTCIVFRLILCS